MKMPRRLLPLLAAGVVCIFLVSNRIHGETAGKGMDPFQGVDIAYLKKSGDTQYSPAIDRWPPPDIDMYPVIVRGDSGAKSLLLRVVLQDIEDRKMRPFEITIDGASASLDLNEAGKGRVDSRGCRPTAEVILPGHVDLMRRIAASADIEAVYGGRKRRIVYRFEPDDLERFRRMLAIFDKGDLPPLPSSPTDRVKPGRPVDPMKPGDSYPEAIPAFKVAPQYPREAMGRHLNATVVLEAQILRDGSVGKVRILKPAGGGCGFEESALAAVKQWKYVPGKVNGQPVDVDFTIAIDFSTYSTETQDPFMKGIESRGRRPGTPSHP